MTRPPTPRRPGVDATGPLESEQVPIQPFRTALYDPDELLGGYDPDDPQSWVTTHDFVVYRAWVASGGVNGPHVQAIAQAIHDSSIAEAMESFRAGRRLVGIMGGHRLSRSGDPADAYAGVVALARRLTRDGVTCVSGGGPGAMEATHLGARTAGLSWDDVQRHLDTMAAHPTFPAGIADIVRADGTVDTDAVARLHAWQAPAFAVASATAVDPGVSLGVPTWHYGHEPPTPLATHIAKHFHNAVREDGLLAIADAGVVFFPGAAGTLQEVFQDACQNYYGLHGLVSPMVFVGERHWTEVVPVWPVVLAMFDDESLLHLTDDVDGAADFLATHPPVLYVGA